MKSTKTDCQEQNQTGLKSGFLRGVTTDNIKDFVKPYLKCLPVNIVLSLGSNNSINDSSSVILNNLLSLKSLPKLNYMNYIT